MATHDKRLPEGSDDAASPDLPAEGSSGGSRFVMGMALGALLGAGLVLLLRQDGRARGTRRRLQREWKALKARTGEEWDEFKQEMRRELARLRG